MIRSLWDDPTLQLNPFKGLDYMTKGIIAYTMLCSSAILVCESYIMLGDHIIFGLQFTIAVIVFNTVTRYREQNSLLSHTKGRFSSILEGLKYILNYENILRRFKPEY
jgi:hypothetical protein